MNGLGFIPVAGWQPGSSSGTIFTSQLIGEFLLATTGLSDQTAAELAGVGERTLRHWQRGGTKRLNRRSRERLLSFLGR